MFPGFAFLTPLGCSVKVPFILGEISHPSFLYAQVEVNVSLHNQLGAHTSLKSAFFPLTLEAYHVRDAPLHVCAGKRLKGRLSRNNGYVTILACLTWTLY